MPRRTRPPRTPCTAPPDPPAYSVRRTADIRAARSCRISRRRIGRGLASPRRTPRRISSRRQTLQARLAVQARSQQSRRGRAIGHGAGRSTRLLSSAQADSPPGRLHAYIHSQFSARRPLSAFTAGTRQSRYPPARSRLSPRAYGSHAAGTLSRARRLSSPLVRCSGCPEC